MVLDPQMFLFADAVYPKKQALFLMVKSCQIPNRNAQSLPGVNVYTLLLNMAIDGNRHSWFTHDKILKNMVVIFHRFFIVCGKTRGYITSSQPRRASFTSSSSISACTKSVAMVPYVPLQGQPWRNSAALAERINNGCDDAKIRYVHFLGEGIHEEIFWL